MKNQLNNLLFNLKWVKMRYHLPSQSYYLTMLWLMLITGLLFLTSCCNDDEICNDPQNPECSNYDPCFGIEDANARFSFALYYNISEWTPDSLIYFELKDTYYIASTQQKLWFKASNLAMNSYSWTIGADPREFTDSVFFLNFSGFTGTLPAELSVSQTKPDNCNANIILEDTSNDKIYFKLLDVLGGEKMPIVGFYKGVDTDAPLDTFVIEVRDRFEDGVGDSLFNFPREGCAGSFGVTITGHQDYIILRDNKTDCFAPHGTGRLEADRKTLIINYSIQLDPFSSDRVSRQWIGIKT